MIADLQRQLGIDFSFFYQFVIFFLTYLWLDFVYFAPYSKLIAKRESQSGGLEEKSKELEEKTVQLEAQFSEGMTAARKEASLQKEKILAEARKAASVVVGKARDDAKKKMDSARERVTSEAKAELDSLQGQVSSFSSALVEKLLKSKVGI